MLNSCKGNYNKKQNGTPASKKLITKIDHPVFKENDTLAEKFKYCDNYPKITNYFGLVPGPSTIEPHIEIPRKKGPMDYNTIYRLLNE